MPGLYNDIVSVIPITKDQWKSVTEGTPKEYYCRFYNKAKEKYSNSGKPISYEYMILIKGNADVKIGDLVSIIKFKGVAETGFQKMEVAAVLKTGSFAIHHTEVYV
jgi:hypothetical protein